MFSQSIDFAARFLTLALFAFWQFYWIITERVADREKPKAPPRQKAWFVRRSLSIIFGIILLLQLFGLSIFPLALSPESLFVIQLVGCLLVIVGVIVAVSARKTLGTNWAHAFEYQIKQKHELITGGVYQKIRHPIYTGLILGGLGGELVVGSSLSVGVVFLVFFGYVQAKREEKILLAHFGEAYKNYMKRSQMFFPYLW